MKDVEILEYYTPKEVAEVLKISPPTLRKYCNLIKKEYGRDYFKRDDTNARLFTEKDILLLKRIISLKKAPDITVGNAVSIVLSEGGSDRLISDISEGDTSDRITKQTDIALLQNYKELIEKQGTQMTQLSSFTRELIESNIKLSEQVEKLSSQLEGALKEIEPPSSETSDKKGGFFSRLFNK